MKCKKILAGFLSVVISATMLLTTGTITTDDTYISVNQTEEPVVQSGEVMEMKASNSIGNYITNMVDQEEEAVAQENQLEGYSITALEFDAEAGIALVESSQKIACTVSVKVVTEEGKEITATEQKAVAGNDVITELKVNTSILPKSYRITADLLDPLENKCCSTFTCNDYTKEMQEIFEADVDDFEEEYVVNLDDDKSTNFMVLDEETVIADSTPEVNTLVSADYEEGIFVFENVDDTISELEQDDYFYTCSNEEDIVAIKVDSVKIKNGVATLKQSDDNIDEMFDFIKIETISDDVSNVEIDTSTADSDITVMGNEVDEEQEIDLGESVMSTTKANNVKIAASASHSLSLSTEIEKGVFKLSPKISLGAKINFNFYKRWNYVNIKFSISTPLTVSLKISASSDNLVSETCSINQGFGVMNVPTGVPGVYVKMEPRFCVEFSGTLSCTYTTEPEFGFIYDSVTGMSSINKSGKENSDLSVELKGKAFIGVEFEPKCVVLSESIAKFGVKAKMGVEISGELSYVSSSDGESVEGSSNLFCFDSSGDTIHTCTACVDGSVNFIFNASVELTVLTVRASLDIANISVPIADKFYFSDELGFGIGECPNKGYKTIFKITNSSGSPLSSYKIQVENVELKTKSDGTASVYARNGTYYYDVYDSLGYSVYRGRVEVYNSKKTIPIVIDNSGNVTIGTPQEVVITTTTVSTAPPITTTTETTVSTASKLDILEAGKLGDNITYILYNDGYMWIYGYGDMYDSSYLPISNREKVLEVEIENEDEENGKVITSIGCVFWGCSNLPSITIPESVTSIDDYAFYDCTSLESIVIPDSVTSIGVGVFNGCTSLKNVTIGKGVTSIDGAAFANCTSLESIIIPNNVTEMGGGSFYNCTSLKNVSLPKGSSNILISNVYLNSPGTYGFFEGCTSLESIVMPEGVKFIGTSAFKDCTKLKSVVLSNTVTEIYRNSFENCTSLEEVTICDSIIEIEYDAFSTCAVKKLIIADGSKKVTAEMTDDLEKYVEEVVIPDSVTSIEVSAFYGFTNLPSITIPESVTSIDDYAFYDCTSLESIIIPDSVTSIGDYAFGECTSLESIVIPDSVTSIGVGVFNGCTSLKNVTIGKGVTSIDGAAFANCTSLESIIIPNNVTEMGGGSFYNCTSLKNVSLPKGSSNILISDVYLNYPGTYGFFEGCTSLESIVMPEGVKFIGTSAFKDCTKLKSVVLSNTVTEIYRNSFENCTSLEIIVINNPDCEIYDSKDTILDTATIYGYRNSTAQAYAEKYNRKFVTLDEEPVITTTVVTTTTTTTETTVSTTSSAKVTTSKNTTATTKATTTNLTTTTKQTTITTVITTKITTTTTSKPLNGDVNGDGIISIADVILVQKALVKANVNVDFSIVDINKDNKFNVFDLIIVKRMVLKK